MRFGAFCAALLVCAILCCDHKTQAASQPMIEPHAQAMPLLPFLDYLLDESLAMDIEDASAATGWQPLILSRLPRAEGILWLRFKIAPLAPDARAQTFLLDPGQSIPGEVTLYEPIASELSGRQEWRPSQPGQRNIFLLPEAGPDAQICYIRMNGLPGPWFAPMIRTPHNAATNWGSMAHTGAVLALAVVMALCLLRGFSEKGQWRYWTALFVAAALGQAILGMPQISDYWTAANLAAVLCPGIALMLLPHVGRHMLNAAAHSKSIDIQLFLLSIPGAILALLPLVPGWDWLFRWTDLWPLAAIIFVPTALGAWIAKLPASSRFLLACAIPPLCVAGGLVAQEFGGDANLLASTPQWGIVLAALLLITAAAPQKREAEKPAQKPAALPEMKLAEEKPKQNEPIIDLEHPLDDPNLRLLPPQQDDAPEVIEYSVPQGPEQLPEECASLREAMELALREPLEDLMRDTAALSACALPPSARQYVAGLQTSAERMAKVISGQQLLPEAVKNTRPPADEPFNLQRILRNAHDSVASGAEYSGNALSWYMPPHMPQLYNGDAVALEETLRLLLESATRATTHGVIKLSARRVPNSPDPGHLLFTVSDNGEGYPPKDRSSLALARAWELAGQFGGLLNVDSSEHGAEIAFSVHFEPLDDEEIEKENAKLPHVVLACDDPGDRRQLARIIEALPGSISEASHPGEALQCQRERPTSLLITKGRMARPSSADMVSEFKQIARNAGFAACYALAITEDDSQWALLKASGFTHAMLEPIDPDVLRRTVAKLARAREESSQDKAAQPSRDQGDAAPTMLIEHALGIASSFEGPDWLGNDEPLPDANTSPAANTQPAGRNAETIPSHADENTSAASNTQAAGRSAECVTGQNSPSAPAAQANASPASNRDAQPQVADATPKAPDAHQTASGDAPKMHPHYSAPASAVEWVGEPMPIGSHMVPDNSPEPQETSAQPAPESGTNSLEDFIIGAEPAAGTKKVDEFMQNSASLVTSTLSSMLTKESAEPEIRHQDPAIEALLQRLDRAMTNATGAFDAGNAAGVADAAAMITRDAEEFGLRVIARLSSCVERAARAPDMAALKAILPDLQSGIERNKITLLQKSGR